MNFLFADGNCEMQGIVYMPQNFETASSPPHKDIGK